MLFAEATLSACLNSIYLYSQLNLSCSPSGELEITSLVNFCRAGNLIDLLKETDKFPEKLQPYLPELLSLLAPQPFTPMSSQINNFQALEKALFAQLIERLNLDQSEDRRWMASDQFLTASLTERRGYSPVVAQAKYLKRFKHDKYPDVRFATFDENPDDSVVEVFNKSTKTSSFGKIKTIFTHERVTILGNEPISDTWASVEDFVPVPMEKVDPFDKVDEPDMEAYLFCNKCKQARLIHVKEIVAHCSFVVYAPGEVHDLLNIPTIAIISMNRE